MSFECKDSTGNEQFPECRLPEELERHIFELCALETPSFVADLCLVARRVHAWVQPIMFYSMSFGTPKSITRTKLLYPPSVQPPDELAGLTRYLILDELPQWKSWRVLESLFTNVTHLGFLGLLGESTRSFPLQHVALFSQASLMSFCASTNEKAVWTETLTHLTYCTRTVVSGQPVPSFHYFRSLTHVAFSVIDAEPFWEILVPLIENALQVTQLTACVILVVDDFDNVPLAQERLVEEGVVDPRAIVIYRQIDALEEREDFWEIEQSIWDEAQGILHRA